MDDKEFFAELRQAFPELVPELDDGISTGLLHLEMAELARLAEGAIVRRDRDTLQRCFAFAARTLETGTPSVQNAVAVSFLEHTLLEPSNAAEREAEALLPSPLQDELAALRDYCAELRRRAKATPAVDRKSKPHGRRRTRR